MASFQKALENFAKFFGSIAAQRQILIGGLASSREAGVVSYLAPYVANFEASRQILLSGAANLDRDLATLRSKDAAKWNAVLAELNKMSAAVPGMTVSSTSMFDIVSAAVPPIPQILLQPVNSVAIQNTLNAEKARYASSNRVAGLGALFLAVVPFIPQIVGGIVAIAATVGLTVIATSFFSRDADTFEAQAEVLSQRNNLLLEGIPNVLKTLPEKDRKDALARLADFGADPKLPDKGGIPLWVWLVLGGVAVYVAWPYIGGAVTRQGARIKAAYGVAGLPRRRRMARVRRDRRGRFV